MELAGIHGNLTKLSTFFVGREGSDQRFLPYPRCNAFMQRRVVEKQACRRFVLPQPGHHVPVAHDLAGKSHCLHAGCGKAGGLGGGGNGREKVREGLFFEQRAIFKSRWRLHVRAGATSLGALGRYNRNRLEMWHEWPVVCRGKIRVRVMVLKEMPLAPDFIAGHAPAGCVSAQRVARNMTWDACALLSVCRVFTHDFRMRYKTT